MPPFELKLAGDTALVVEFGEHVDRHVSGLVLRLARAISTRRIAGVLDVVPTFRSLMIRYEPLVISADELGSIVQASLDGPDGLERPGRCVELPVCFGAGMGPDIDYVADASGLSEKDLIEAMASVSYHVYMLGFLPGQPYLGDLPAGLDLPRRETPRMRVAEGSVGIAKGLACVYPAETPCGWHIVGRSPARLWRGADPLLAPGDEVRLNPISLEAFERLATAA